MFASGSRLLLCVTIFALSARADVPLLERDVLPILTKNCMGCHGDNGEGDKDEDIPKLAGVSVEEQVKAWKEYKAGSRDDEDGDMTELAKELSDSDYADLSTYYANM